MAKRRQLRAIDGPLSGASFLLRGRVRLGRAGDSDIQLVHDGVSRQHAQVIEDSAGNPVLMDLASNNGTFVGDKRVTRHRLVPGDVVRIMRARFVYEEVEDEGADPESGSGVFAVKVNSADTHRRTVDHWQLDLPAPRRDSSSDAGGAMVVEPGAARHRVVATMADGSAYPGDLLGDVMDYRALRIRSLRQEPLSDAEIRRFGALQGALHEPAQLHGDSRRKFYRFRCGFPARLRYGEHFGDRTARVTVVDFSAGGAGVQMPGLALEIGELAWLVIDLVVGSRPKTIVLTGRIVSCDAGVFGLLFAGAPEWEQWRGPVG
jgi:hypothetical protein